MRIVEVIESKHWKNKITGQTASIYGSVPYTSEVDKQNWSIELRGYTWRLDNGTIGLGRMPVKTKEEALNIMNSFNERK
jgi:hypothetical protein